MITTEIVEFFKRELETRKNNEEAEKMESYMKHIQSYLGVKTPSRIQIYKNFKKKFSHVRTSINTQDFQSLIQSLWNQEYREYRYVAIFLIEYFNQHIKFEQIEFFENLIIKGAWWDTTDSFHKIFATILLDEPKKMSEKMMEWINSSQLWLRRSSLLVQLSLKEKTNETLLKSVIIPQMKDKEFFIKKAIGWALREYSKTNPDWVYSFINIHKEKLSKLSKREGSKYLKVIP